MLQNATASNLQKMMQNGDPVIITAIPLNVLLSSGFNVSSVPAANLPPAYVN